MVFKRPRQSIKFILLEFIVRYVVSLSVLSLIWTIGSMHTKVCWTNTITTYLQPLPYIYFPEVSRHLGHDAPYLLMSLALTNAPSSIHFIYIYITMVLKNPNMVITCLWESSIRSSILSFFLWTWWCWWYHQNHQPFLIESIAWMGWPLAKLALVFNGHIFLGVLAPLSYYSACRERYVAGMWGRRDQKQ
jgi:hypothetical protein